MTCSFLGAVAYDIGYWETFGVIYSLDAIASIGAMVPPHCRTTAPPHRRTAAPLHAPLAPPVCHQIFLSGPRKYCSGVLTNGSQRAVLGLTYWWFILLTIGLCFIPAKPYVIILCIVVQKFFWALNLAASCGCLDFAATSSSTDKASGARAKTAPGQSTAGVELPVVSRAV